MNGIYDVIAYGYKLQMVAGNLVAKLRLQHFVPRSVIRLERSCSTCTNYYIRTNLSKNVDFDDNSTTLLFLHTALKVELIVGQQSDS